MPTVLTDGLGMNDLTRLDEIGRQRVGLFVRMQASSGTGEVDRWRCQINGCREESWQTRPCRPNPLLRGTCTPRVWKVAPFDTACVHQSGIVVCLCFRGRVQ